MIEVEKLREENCKHAVETHFKRLREQHKKPKEVLAALMEHVECIDTSMGSIHPHMLKLNMKIYALQLAFNHYVKR